jgi:hypothetical protein
MMDGRSARLDGPLSARAKRMIAVAGAVVVAAFAGVGIWGATHSDSYGGSRDGCVTVAAPSSTGGALQHACGGEARAMCQTAFAGHDKIALLTQAQCRLAGLGPGASPAP